MPTIELDYSSDNLLGRVPDDEEQARTTADVDAMLQETGFTDVTYEIVQLNGPAGGASVIDFTAPTAERLREFVTMYDAGNGEVDWLMESVR